MTKKQFKLTDEEIWHISRAVRWIDTEGEDKKMDRVSKKLSAKFDEILNQNKKSYIIK